jgi:membrane associated rhomboid family serine protease
MRRILGDRDFPIATYSLIGFNILLYLALIGTIREEIYREWALVPGRAGLLQMFTSTFLHASVPHLALNMLLLYLFGRRVERGGRKRRVFPVLYRERIRRQRDAPLHRVRVHAPRGADAACSGSLRRHRGG